MTDERVEEVSGVRVLVSPVGLVDERGAVDLISQAVYDHDATWVALGADLLGDEFFDLRTGRAGAITQKFVQYGVGFAVIGDLTDRLAESKPLRDWVRESNRGRSVVFVPALDELADRLQGR
ncbi:DUF4180 domain-containing protein [Kribbella capetownensis]|uniref:DUF4180 domain-containing protein n=1 Tax=Kribbella capetownensis TaxID=1572659 RepID=A0A4R0JU88_9ACTN|nr:DUF4180 domain-containing protein [Kribbella capetownensis]TCC50117.1 DUF4180 domain-containing protein [Kribbella capetownensis]